LTASRDGTGRRPREAAEAAPAIRTASLAAGEAREQQKSSLAAASLVLEARRRSGITGVESGQGRFAMDDQPLNIPVTVHPGTAEMERMGDQIAELSAHLEAATARLLDLIREFDARGGWGNGFRSCAHWLSWRVGLDPGAAREKVRVARALGTLPLLAAALACPARSCRTRRCGP
jgi:hypothetical protein